MLNVVEQDQNISSVHQIFSGKFRRYHGEGFKQLLDLHTLLKNLRDLVYIVIGFIQSLILLKKSKPNVVFIKGGFVGVPVGLAAAILRIPFVTHDSDAIPGLANRIISRWAKAHAVAMPKEIYGYPANQTFQVGTPISDKYQPVNTKQLIEFKKSFGLDDGNQVLLITGGGLGAQRLNMSVARISNKLLTKYSNLVILHIAGPGKDDELAEEYEKQLSTDQLGRVVVEPFVSDLYRYSGAADIVICRASATTLTELAEQGKACIVLPNNQLTGGHQSKNAEILSGEGAIVSLKDDLVAKNPEILLHQIENLLNDSSQRIKLANSLHKTSDPDAANNLAKIVIRNGVSE